jgi:nickel superoxide dismutase
MKKCAAKKILLAAGGVLAIVLVSLAYSHCQIPCGIYGDEARFDMIAENATTIEKSMKQITELSAQTKSNMNQVVRWVQNKEKHADDTSEIITYYFMAQRVKPAAKSDAKAYEEYVEKLTVLHEMLVSCMKAKQTTELSHVAKLRASLGDFHKVYFGKSCEEHGHEHKH